VPAQFQPEVYQRIAGETLVSSISKLGRREHLLAFGWRSAFAAAIQWRDDEGSAPVPNWDVANISLAFGWRSAFGRCDTVAR